MKKKMKRLYLSGGGSSWIRNIKISFRKRLDYFSHINDTNCWGKFFYIYVRGLFQMTDGTLSGSIMERK